MSHNWTEQQTRWTSNESGPSPLPACVRSELEIMLQIVEDTRSETTDNVTMRIATLESLINSEQLGLADSRTLRIYAIDHKKLYGKTIQCAAMTELARRTAQRRLLSN